MSTDKVWLQNLGTGKYGERLFKNLALQNGFEVEDKTEDKSYFEKDIDFIISKSDIKTTCEVKSCNLIWRTGNFVVEKTEDVERNKKGWYYKSEADLFIHVDIRNEIIRIFEFKHLREFIELMLWENENKQRNTTCKLWVVPQYDYASDYSNRKIERLNWIINMGKFIKWNQKNGYFYEQYDLSDLEINF